MPRKPRENIDNGDYHVYARGNDRRAVFEDDIDRRNYLRLLGSTVQSLGWRCFAYCLMPNHLHLLVRTPNADLSEGMQKLQGSYVLGFNARHGSVGHLFQGRYGAKLVRSDRQLQLTAAYIARNPTAAGLCEHAEDWAWGSYQSVVRGAGPPWLHVADLLGWFAAGGGDPRRRLGSLVDVGPPPDDLKALLPRGARLSAPR